MSNQFGVFQASKKQRQNHRCVLISGQSVPLCLFSTTVFNFSRASSSKPFKMRSTFPVLAHLFLICLANSFIVFMSESTKASKCFASIGEVSWLLQNTIGLLHQRLHAIPLAANLAGSDLKLTIGETVMSATHLSQTFVPSQALLLKFLGCHSLNSFRNHRNAMHSELMWHPKDTAEGVFGYIFPKSDLNRFHAQLVSKHNSGLNRFHACTRNV